MRISRAEAEPYFNNFKAWLRVYYPEALFRVEFGEIGPQDLRMLIVEWAADITQR